MGRLSDPVNGALQPGQCRADFPGIVEETLKVFTGMSFITLVPHVGVAIMLIVHF